MVVAETVGIVAFAGLISAFAIWGCPKLRCSEGNASKKLLIFSQGQCGEYLLPCDRDLERIEKSNCSKRKKSEKDENAEQQIEEQVEKREEQKEPGIEEDEDHEKKE